MEQFLANLTEKLGTTTYPKKISTKGLSTLQSKEAKRQLEECGFTVREEIDDDGPLRYLDGFILNLPTK
jgi:hypothetical protein